MKRIILSLSLMLLTGLAFSQSIVLFRDGIQLNNDDVVQIDSVLGGSGMAEVHVNVKNNTSQEISVKVRRTIIDTIPGTINYFCWAGQCFSPNVYDSPNSELIAPGATTGSDRFYADYFSNDIQGITKIRYTFYNEFNSNDTASVIVYFSYGHSTSSQLLVLYRDGVELTNDAIIQIDSVIGGSGMAEVHVNVKNNTSQEMFVKVRRTIIDTIPGTINYFCWAGQCFSPSIYDSPNSELIAAGAITGSDRFYADYFSNDIQGITKIRYTFYNEFNTNDTASVIVYFNYGQSASSQSLVLFRDGVEHTNDAIIQIDSVIGGSGMAQVHFNIRNNTSQEISVKVRRTIIDTIPGTINYFCWAGQCFGPSIYDSPNSELIAAGATTSSDRFYADYDSFNKQGITKIRYTFYNEFNVNDTASVIVYFSYGYLSVNDLLAKSTFSNTYPNPASSKVSFDYQLPEQVKTAGVKLYNIVGQEVKSEYLTGVSGKLELDLNNLNEGIYFMTIILNGEAAKTSRIIVQK